MICGGNAKQRRRKVGRNAGSTDVGNIEMLFEMNRARLAKGKRVVIRVSNIVAAV